MDNPVFLTKNDATILKQVIDEFRNRTRTALNRASSPPEENSSAPTIYVALTPASGIPALSPSSSGTGGFDSPAGVECAIYRLLDVDLVPINRHELIYNLSTTAVAGGKYVRIARDPWGTWYAEGGSTGGSSAFSGAKVGVNNQTITTNTETTLSFTTPSWDTDSYFSGGSPTKLTVAEDGYYTAGVLVQWDVGAGSGSRSVFLSPVAGDSTIAQDERQAAPLLSATCTIESTFFMNAGDYFQVDVLHEDGSDLNVVLAYMWVNKLSSGPAGPTGATGPAGAAGSSPTIGGPIGGGTAQYVLFVGAGPVLAQSSGLTFDGSNLRVPGLYINGIGYTWPSSLPAGPASVLVGNASGTLSWVDGGVSTYTVGASGSWSGSPTTIGEALDRIAAVVSLSGASPIP